MMCYRNFLKVSWMEHRTNHSVRKDLKVEDQWSEIFIKKQKLSRASGKDHLRGGYSWEKRKRKTKKAMAKGHTRYFRHIINRSWKISALGRERFRCEVKDASSSSSRAFSHSLLIEPYSRLIHYKLRINNFQNQLTRRAWFPSWPGRSWYSISAIST